MTREQQYMYEQYVRRSQLLRNYARLAAVGGQTEKEKQENPTTPEDLLSGLQNPEMKNIKISDNISLSSESMIIEDGRELTIDLHGNNIKAESTSTEDSALTVKRGATLVLKDDSGNGMIDAADKMCALKLSRKGDDDSKTASVQIDGGQYVGKSYVMAGNGSRQNTNAVINDGTFHASDAEECLAVFHPQNGYLEINGGDFYGKNTVWVKSGTVVINGGTFEADGVSAEYQYSGNGFYNTGDCIVVDNCKYPGSTPDVKIYGGKFISRNASPVASYSAKESPVLSGFVFGGSFNKKLDDSLIAEGYQQTQDGEYWVVTKIA